MGSFLYYVINGLLSLLVFALIANAIVSWLVAFDIINVRNRIAYQVIRFLDAVTTPVLAPFRRFMPNLGGVDISPILAILVITGIQRYLLPMAFGPIIAAIG